MRVPGGHYYFRGMVSVKLIYFLFPVVILVAGIILHITSKVKINSLYGFRTKTSSKNQQTWEYCNKLCAKILILIGISSIVIILVFGNVQSMFWQMFTFGEFVNVLDIIVVLLCIPVINFSCRKKFPDLFHRE